MAHRKCKAIMGCTEKQYPKVLARAGSVRMGLYKRTDLYPTPDIDEDDFETQYQAAFSAQATVKGGGLLATSVRNTEVGKLFAMLRFTLLLQVNKLYEDNRVNLEASGFGVSKDPTPAQIPEQPVIKDIVNANSGTSYGAKVLLIKKTNPLNEKKERYTYLLQMSKEKYKEEAYETILITQNMHKLIAQDLKRGEEVFFRVAKFNARGQSRWSEPADFIPR